MEPNEERPTDNELVNDNPKVWTLFIGLFIVSGILFLPFSRLLGSVDPEMGTVYYYFWHDGRLIPGYFLGYLFAMLGHLFIKQIKPGYKELKEWMEIRRLR